MIAVKVSNGSLSCLTLIPFIGGWMDGWIHTVLLYPSRKTERGRGRRRRLKRVYKLLSDQLRRNAKQVAEGERERSVRVYASRAVAVATVFFSFGYFNSQIWLKWNWKWEQDI